ncbi:monodechloroaminopyrrolnitrin synthase PrnB family protein (plasmid) [Legionella sp. D16C41]|uniref:monodechloroaminopyrrolnitrin synthase PrnB family protein n=1 Tax=Legionella sp. D16C41 TaxID=3402688 RepID=UPI003AF8FBB1
MSSANQVEAFDYWIRTSFVEMNTELENLYFAQENPALVRNCGDSIKMVLHNEGHSHVITLLKIQDIKKHKDIFLDLLGNVGFYFAALRRHELTNPAQEICSPFIEASALALQAGLYTGMVPRFATAHLTIRNKAIAGKLKSFTSLPDELLFIDENTRGIFSFQRAANAVKNWVYVGASSPIADIFYTDAKQALENVFYFNSRLFERLDVKRFFFSVRPYYKPYRVGQQEYRGANAGDFSGINELDLLLGLFTLDDYFYLQLLTNKMFFMLPSDRDRLQDCFDQLSLLDELLNLSKHHAHTDWFQQNVIGFLEVCEIYKQIAIQHHKSLVKHFIEEPATQTNTYEAEDITASGPPLSVVIKELERLRDVRSAVFHQDVATRYADMMKLKKMVGM